MLVGNKMETKLAIIRKDTKDTTHPCVPQVIDELYISRFKDSTLHALARIHSGFLARQSSWPSITAVNLVRVIELSSSRAQY